MLVWVLLALLVPVLAHPPQALQGAGWALSLPASVQTGAAVTKAQTHPAQLEAWMVLVKMILLLHLP